MNRDQMISHLSLLGFVAAVGAYPNEWYGIYAPTRTLLVSNYIDDDWPTSHADDFSEAEMRDRGNCYAEWDSITDGQLIELFGYVHRGKL